MCRAVAYLGDPLTLDVVLYRSDSALVRQAYDPTMFDFMNLAGCGLAAWDEDSIEPDLPLLYKETTLPMYDRNLMRLARKVRTHCAIAHVRGCDYFGSDDPLVSRANLHPFQFDGCEVTMAHNGDLAGFRSMRRHLVEHLSERFEPQIEGTTDSEWIYALVASCLERAPRPLDADHLGDAVEETLDILRSVRRRMGIHDASPVNLFLSDGRYLVCTRFVFDFGRHGGRTPRARHLLYQSLWFTAGHSYGLYDDEWRMAGGPESATSVLVASEPLTRDTSTWIEVPEYHMITAARVGEAGELRIQARELRS